MIHHAIDILMMIGGVAVAVWIFRMGRSGAAAKAEVPADALKGEPLRDAMVADAEAHQKAIGDAGKGSDPATALADLGNERRK